MRRARAKGDLAMTRNPENSSRVSFGANIWSSWNSYTLGRIMSRALRRRRSDNHSSRESRSRRAASWIFARRSLWINVAILRGRRTERHSRATKSGKFNKLASLWVERGERKGGGERERDKEKRERAFIRRMQLRVATSDRRVILRGMHRRRRHPSTASRDVHRDSTGYTLVFGTSGRCYRELTRTSHWFRDLRNTPRVRYDVPVTNYALDLDSCGGSGSEIFEEMSERQE